jgi:hypothetical protein
LLRLCFNTMGAIHDAAAGNLTKTIVRESRLSPVTSAELGAPYGTLSQIVAYFDGSVKIAVAHRYLMPDGRLAAAGLPDPKRMLCCGVIMYTTPTS